MKVNYFIIILIACSSNCLGQGFLNSVIKSVKVIEGEKTIGSALKEYQVVFGMVRNPNQLNYWRVDGEVNPPAKPYDNILQSESHLIKDVFKYSRIAIRVYSTNEARLINLGESGLKLVSITVGSNDPVTIPVTDEDKRIHDKYIDIERLIEDEAIKVQNGEDIDVDLEFDSEGKRILVPTFRGKFKKNFSLYEGLNTSTAGFWIPALLFSSNLSSDSTGIPFASMPIGLAWGIKRNLKRGYIGFSPMANWLIYSDGDQTEEFTTKSNFSVSNLSLGLLVDINDAIYIGYSYGYDFRKGATNPGSMLVIGFGSKAIRFLKSKNPEQ